MGRERWSDSRFGQRYQGVRNGRERKHNRDGTHGDWEMMGESGAETWRMDREGGRD